MQMKQNGMNWYIFCKKVFLRSDFKEDAESVSLVTSGRWFQNAGLGPHLWV